MSDGGGIVMNGNVFRRLWAALVVGLMALSGAIHAQPEGLKIDVEASLGGYYRPERWTPVFVQLSNQPGKGQSLADVTDFAGQLMIVADPVQGTNPVRYVREVDVPRASTKRYALYAHFPEPESANAPQPELKLTEPNGRVIGSVALPVTPLRKTDTLLVSIGDSTTPPALPRLRDQFDRVIYSQLGVDSMPDLWTGYDAADIVVLQRWPDRGVSPVARQALMDWVAMGGTLVLLSGSEEASYADESARELLPVEIAKSGLLVEDARGGYTIQPSAEGKVARGSYVTALSKLKPDAEAILAVDGFPILARKRVGLGQVVFFALDLQSQSVALERFIAPAWFAITPVRSLGNAEYELPETLFNQLRILVGGAGRAPSPLVMILICLAYAITVGPINFLVLSRMKKMDWAWFTLPAIVVVFFVLIFLVGRIMKGDSQSMRELVVERYHAGSSQGAALVATSTFVSSASRQSINPALDRGALEFPYRWHQHDEWREARGFGQFTGGLTSTQSFSGTMPVVSFSSTSGEQGNRDVIGVRSINMGTYDARLFLSRGPSTLSGAIEADLRWTTPAVIGTITNRTTNTYRDSWLLMGDSCINIGALEPGAKYELTSDDVVRGFPMSVRRGARPSRWRPVDGLFSTLREQSDDDSQVDKYNAAVVLDALLRPEKSGVMFPPMGGRLCFVGLSDSEKPRSFSTIAARAESRLIVTMVELDLRLDSSDVLPIPPALVSQTPAGYAIDQNGLVYMGGSNELVIRDGRAFVAVELPFFDPTMTVESLVLNVAPRTVEHQDWRVSALIPGPGGGWLDLPAGAGLANRGFAMPGNGRIFLRLESQKNEKTSSMVSWQDGTGFRPLELIYRIRVNGADAPQP
ncbi:hypothetical protein GC173_15345 [bacterium]|nr:hypothetical protein [bacterium]